MLARVDLANKLTYEEFKKQFGKHYATEAKVQKAYEASMKKFPKEESKEVVKK